MAFKLVSEVVPAEVVPAEVVPAESVPVGSVQEGELDNSNDFKGKLFRHVCFTFYAPVDDPNLFELSERSRLKSILTDLYTRLKCQFANIGLEVCKTTGRLHLQGYLQFSDRVSASVLYNPKADAKPSVRARFKGLPKWHVLPADGSAKDNVKYTSKDGNLVFQLGEPALFGRSGRKKGAVSSSVKFDSVVLMNDFASEFVDKIYQLRGKVYFLQVLSGAHSTAPFSSRQGFVYQSDWEFKVFLNTWLSVAWPGASSTDYDSFRSLFFNDPRFFAPLSAFSNPLDFVPLLNGYYHPATGRFWTSPSLVKEVDQWTNDKRIVISDEFFFDEHSSHPVLFDDMAVFYDFSLQLAFDPLKRCPRFDDWLRFICNRGDKFALANYHAIRAYIQLVLLRVHPKLQLYLEIVGDSGTGKGVFCEVLAAFFPKEKVASFALEDFTNRFFLNSFRDVILAISHDSDKFTMAHGRRFLQLTGGDLLSVETKGKNISFGDNFRFQGRVLVVGRQLLGGKYPDFVRRRRVVVFCNPVLQQLGFDNFSDQLISELPGIFNSLFFHFANRFDFRDFLNPLKLFSGDPLQENYLRVKFPSTKSSSLVESSDVFFDSGPFP